MKIIRKAGQTSVIEDIFIGNSSVSTGAGLTGLTNSSSGLTCYYKRKGSASWTSVSLVSATTGTWTSGGFKEGDATNAPGAYELHLPNAVVAAGVESVVVLLKGATNMVPVELEIQLVPWDPQDSVRLGITALPNASAGANTGLPVVGSQVPNANAGANGGLPTGDANGAVALQNAYSPYQRTGTAQAGAAGSITLDAGASATDDYYKGALIAIISGTGAGQAPRVCTGYTGASKVATVGRNWTTAPDNTSVFVVLRVQSPLLSASLGVTVAGYETGQDPASLILVTSGHKIAVDASGNVTVGNYAAGEDPASWILITPADKIGTDGSGNIIGISGVDFSMLKACKTGSVNDAGPTTGGFAGSAGLSGTDHFYEGSVMVFTSGVNAGAPGRRISGYVGGTKSFTFAVPWITAPANGDAFIIIGRID